MVLYVKNHIAASVKFAEIQTINGEDYRSARLSMELGHEAVVSDTGDVRSYSSHSAIYYGAQFPGDVVDPTKIRVRFRPMVWASRTWNRTLGSVQRPSRTLVRT
jgi:hypothetical protein